MYRTLNSEIPENIRGIRYEDNYKDVYDYNELGEHDYFSPVYRKFKKNNITARQILTDTTENYFVAMDSFGVLYNPYKKKHSSSYRINMKNSLNEYVFKLKECRREVFVNYLRYLQNKQRKYIEEAQSLLDKDKK